MLVTHYHHGVIYGSFLNGIVLFLEDLFLALHFWMSWGGRFPRVFGDEFSDKFCEKLGDSQNLVNNLVSYSVTKLVNHQFW